MNAMCSRRAFTNQQPSPSPANMSSPHNAVDDAEQLAVLESLRYAEPPSQDRYAHADSRSAGKTLFVFSIVLAPFVIAPYFLLRRRFSGLVREFEALRNANGSLVREVRASTAEFARERGVLTSGVLNRLNELRQAQDSYRATVEQAGADRTREAVEAVREAQRSAGENAARLAGILEVAAEARRQNYLDDKRWQTETTESIQGLQGQVNRRCVMLVCSRSQSG